MSLPQYFAKLRYGQDAAAVKHSVAVGANARKVRKPCPRARQKAGDRHVVVDFDKAGSPLTVSGAEIETAHFTRNCAGGCECCLDARAVSEFAGSLYASLLRHAVQKGRKLANLDGVFPWRLRVMPDIEVQRQHSFVPIPIWITRHSLPPFANLKRKAPVWARGGA
jgi:hypothetical protein